jgi:hypothetical protein
VTRLSVVDQFSNQPSSTQHRETVSFFGDEATGEDLNGRVLRAVFNDPFASIRDLRRELNRKPGPGMVGWWQVFGVLRRHQLLQKRSRFRYARNRSRANF